MISAETIAAELKKGVDAAAYVVDGEVIRNMYDRGAYECLEVAARGIAQRLSEKNPGFSQSAFLIAAGFGEEA
jgi:hypothetical protein